MCVSKTQARPWALSYTCTCRTVHPCTIPGAASRAPTHLGVIHTCIPADHSADHSVGNHKGRLKKRAGSGRQQPRPALQVLLARCLGIASVAISSHHRECVKISCVQ